MAEQLLSADPQAGRLLSADPAAGIAAAPPNNARMHAPTATDPVTLGDVMDNPAAAFQRIGASLKRDATDPHLWLSLAASYFGPKVVPFAAKAIGAGLKGAKAVGGVLEPGDLGIVSPRVGKAIDLAGRVRGALRPGEAAPSDVSPPGVDRYMPNVSGAEPPPPMTPPPAAAAAAPIPPSAARTEFSAAQAARQATAEPIVAASGKMKLTAAEMKEFSRLVARGMSLPEAAAKVQAMRELASKLGGTMTPAEVTAEIKGRVGNLSPIR